MFRRALRKPMMLLASLLAIVYLSYRVGFTLNLASPYAVFASVLLLVGEVYGVFTMLLYFLQIWEVSEPPRQPVLPDRTVDVFVPTYNEDPQLLRATLQACLRMDYPHRTFVLDDGKRPEVKALAEELGVTYVTRTDNKHAKAGNLNNALKQTDGEFIIIFDADHVPEKHFITRLIGYFADEKIGFVQTPHAFYNFDSFQASHDADKKRYWEEGDMFYGLIQPGKNRFGCAIFAGSAAMFRRKALEEVGGIAVETITEDMHTGMRVNSRGWKSLAVTERLIAGQAAPDVTTFHSQRLRWARGNLSILAVDNPLTMRGLTLGQRLCHLASCNHWLGGLFRLPLYLTPLLFLFSGVPPVADFTWALIALTTVYLLVTWTAVGLAGMGKFSFWNSELFDMMSFWTKTKGAVQALLQGGGKFIVTSKRGRQSKSIWPLLRPHMLLVILTVLSLCWGWGRVGMGLSADWGRLVLATLWALFYVSLATVVIRRALTPDDARYDYRHPVNLGLTYAIEGRAPVSATPRLGLTVDVSERGLGILSYEPLEPDSVLKIELHGAGETLHCHGRVAWSRELFRSQDMPFQGFRNGVALDGLAAPQLDVLQHLCSHYAVSRQYHDVALGTATVAQTGTGNGTGQALSRGLEGRSFEFKLPLVLEIPGDVTKTAYCCTEAVAESGLKVLLPMALASGTPYLFHMGTPRGDVRGRVNVARYDILPLGGQNYYVYTLLFEDFHGHDRDIINALVGQPEDHGGFLSVLKPRREKRRLPLLKPAAIAAGVVLPLLGLQAAAFAWYFKDDIRLRDIAVAPVLKAGETDEVRRISDETERDSHPTTDRLVLLRRAWKRVGDEGQVDRLTNVLATANPNNFELQVALLDVEIKDRDLGRTRAVYGQMSGIVEHRFLPEERKRNLLLAVARACVHGGDYSAAAGYFAEVVKMTPEDRVLRKEYAGVLLRDDHPAEVVAMYGDEEKNAGERFLIASAYRRLNRNEEAERECRIALKEKPDDIPSQLLLAETLRAAGRKDEADALYAGVAEIDPSNETLRMRLAFDAVANGNYPKALELFRPLVAKDTKRSDLARGFIDAAAGASALPAPDRALVVRVYEQTNRDDKQNRLFVDRLAWVLQGMGEHERAASLLRGLVQEDPGNRNLRLRLASCLRALDRDSEVIDSLATLEKDPEALRLRAGLSLNRGDTEMAEKLCREMLAAAPKDAEALNLLAVTQVTRKDYKAAEATYERLRSLRPDNAAVPVRLAELSLWQRDYPRAAGRYQKLLQGSINQPALWQPFVDAAAGCNGNLTAEQKQVAVDLAGAFKNGKDVPATAMTRLGYVLIQAKASPQLVQSLLERAAEKPPEEAEARKELAGVLAAAGLPKQSLNLYQGLTLTPDEQRRLIDVYVAAGELDRAEQLARTLLRDKPDDCELRHQMANILAWAKRYDEAATAYQELIRERPDDLSLRAGLGQVRLWARRYDEALPLYRSVLSAEPGLKEHYAAYIDTAASAANLDAAADGAIVSRVVDWARREASGDVVILKRLTWVCQRVKDRRAAVALLRMTHKLDPRDKKLILELADTLYALGDYAEAEANYLLAGSTPAASSP